MEEKHVEQTNFLIILIFLLGEKKIFQYINLGQGTIFTVLLDLQTLVLHNCCLLSNAKTGYLQLHLLVLIPSQILLGYL